MSGDSSRNSVRLDRAFGDLAVILGVFTLLQYVMAAALYAIFSIAQISSVARDTVLLESASVVFIYVIGNQLAGYGVLTLLVRKLHLSWHELGIARPRWVDAGVAVLGYVIYMAMFVAVAIMLQLLTSVDVNQEQAIGFSKDQAPAGLILAGLTLVVLTPLFEELFFRGYLYGRLRKHGFTLAWATVSTSITFGFLHLFGGVDGLLWIALADTMILSVVLCYVRERTGRIWASVLIHAAKNSLAFVTLFIIKN